MGLEGIVSKRLGSRYRSGRVRDWLKFKNPEALGDAGGRGRLELRGGVVLTHGRLRRLGSATMGVTVKPETWVAIYAANRPYLVRIPKRQDVLPAGTATLDAK